MLLYDLLQMLEPNFLPSQAKNHLARYNGIEQPYDVFIRGDFEPWQAWQNARNFERPYVVSLIQAGSPTRWMFAGLFNAHGCRQVMEPRVHFMYELERVASTEELVGRLFLESAYKKRNSYPLGETLVGDLLVRELLPERVSIGQFPGFKLVNLSKSQLDVVVRQNIEAWRAPLASVKGIYLITDHENGKLYVGKADGEDGIWGRWCAYAATGHGGNVALKNEFSGASPERLARLHFSILEIADIQSTKEEILDRERHWKAVLQSREFGSYNRN